jgi:cytochrome c oxidase cbb3-type subunit 3
MFSFFRRYAETIDGVNVYPKVALFLFLLVFVGMILVALKADKKYIDEIGRLPLD